MTEPSDYIVTRSTGPHKVWQIRDSDGNVIGTRGSKEVALQQAKVWSEKGCHPSHSIHDPFEEEYDGGNTEADN